ncbi:uncharacterized protein L201_007056 [Kwoniella dendrophila CBS 6074]|uniref:Uncharacterized protein n=1 Tax=Kwoniella dendrophila CBS 6074 TaxID=1295534 RepID=A0AAX4K3C4_9TREE
MSEARNVWRRSTNGLGSYKDESLIMVECEKQAVEAEQLLRGGNTAKNSVAIELLKILDYSDVTRPDIHAWIKTEWNGPTEDEDDGHWPRRYQWTDQRNRTFSTALNRFNSKYPNSMTQTVIGEVIHTLHNVASIKQQSKNPYTGHDFEPYEVLNKEDEAKDILAYKVSRDPSILLWIDEQYTKCCEQMEQTSSGSGN